MDIDHQDNGREENKIKRKQHFGNGPLGCARCGIPSDRPKWLSQLDNKKPTIFLSLRSAFISTSCFLFLLKLDGGEKRGALERANEPQISSSYISTP